MGNGFGSLYIGASGLQNAQYALNTTANNLANVNTTGYVRQQVRFADKNYNKLNIYNIPPRTKEQKANRYSSRNQSSLLDYKDEDVEKLVTEIYESIYGAKENIFEDHDICLSIFLITEFFKKYQKYREEKHPMVTPSQAENILKMVSNPDTDMAKDDLVDDKEEPLFYLDMMEEHFKTKWGKRNGGDFDYRIMLFFKDTTQNMLYQRVKQKREDTL